MPEIEWINEPQAIDRDASAPRGIPCEACGTPVEALDKFCPACGTANPSFQGPDSPPTPAGAQQALDAEVVAEPPASPLSKHFECKQCGAQVAVSPEQRSYVCAFCDSTYVVELPPQATGRQPPEFVIGFAISPEQAHEKFHKWFNDNPWYRPGDLKAASVLDKIQGVYLPFWSFSMLAESAWKASIGQHWYRTETYTTTDAKGNVQTRTRRVQETEWYPLSGRHHRYYSGYLVSGSKGLPQNQSERIQPFQLPALKRYEPFFLAGWKAEEYSVTAAEALAICQREFHRREQANIAAFLPGDTHRAVEAHTQFSQVNSDLCLLPIYIASYRYHGTVYRFLLNGQTGRLAGDKPISWRRITAVVLGVLGVIGLIALAIAAAGR